MDVEGAFPTLRQVVLDCVDARALAEFYRQLLGLAYRPGDEPPAAGEPDPTGQDWLVLQDSGGGGRVAPLLHLRRHAGGGVSVATPPSGPVASWRPDRYR